jgi:hypothetical protein
MSNRCQWATWLLTSLLRFLTLFFHNGGVKSRRQLVGHVRQVTSAIWRHPTGANREKLLAIVGKYVANFVHLRFRLSFNEHFGRGGSPAAGHVCPRAHQCCDTITGNRLCLSTRQSKGNSASIHDRLSDRQSSRHCHRPISYFLIFAEAHQSVQMGEIGQLEPKVSLPMGDQIAPSVHGYQPMSHSASLAMILYMSNGSIIE